MKRNEPSDFEFIKDKFEKTYPATPDSLSEDAINQLLSSKQEPKTVKLKPKFNVKAIVSAAAGFVLLLGIMYAAYIGGLFPGDSGKVGNYYNEVNISSTFSDSDDSKGTYEDYAELDSILDRMGWDPMEGMGGDGIFNVQLVDKDENVQEPDKTKYSDGYVYRTYHDSVTDESGKDKDDNRIYIFKANGEKLELVSVINYEVGIGEGYSDSLDVRMNNLFVYNDRLIVELFVNDDDSSNQYDRDCHKSVTQIYDISDKSAPKLLSEFEQSGMRISSQMIGKYLYTVSNYCASKDKGKYKFPSCGNLSKADLIPAQNISVFDNSYTSRYVVVSAIDVEKAEKVSDSKAVLGASENVFFCDDDLYFIDFSYEYIIRAQLNGGTIELSEKVRVNGNFDYNVQFAKSNGLLYIFNYDHSNVLVLNEELEVIGEAKDAAGYNGISTARFDGDLMYTVTRSGEYWEGYEYELRVIDFSDPQNPTLLGEATLYKDIKQMIPVDDYLLCIGETYESDHGAVTLFDVSDKLEPKLLDTKEFDGDLHLDIYSGIFIVDPENGCLAISAYSKGESEEYGVVTFEIADGKIEITNQFVNENACENKELIVAGDYLYCFDTDYNAPIDEAIIISSHKYK